MAQLTDLDLREHVRARYSEAALRMADRDATAGCGCGCRSTEAGTCCSAGTSLGCGVDISETHRVHAHASSAIVRARKPGG